MTRFNFIEEVEEAYWFGPVRPSVRYVCTRSRDRILKFGMWDEYENDEDLYNFSCPSDLSLQSYCPFQGFFSIFITLYAYGSF